jgi:PAS domain S-box-containing protein
VRNDSKKETQAIAKAGAQRKTTAQRLKDSEVKYRRLFEAAQDGILILNGDTGHIIDANPFITDLLGYTRTEVVGKHLWEIGAFKDIDASKIAYTELQQKNHIRYNYLPLETKNKRLIDIEFVSNAYQVDGSRIIQCNIRDVTEHMKLNLLLQQKSEQSEKRYHSLFDNMLNGFAYCRMLFDGDQPQDFIYLDVNGSFEKQIGLKNVVGKKVSEVIPGLKESSPELFETYARVALTGQSERFEFYVPQLDIWLDISVYSSEREYFIAVFDNITERKRSEQTLKESERRYRLLAENTVDVIWAVDLNMRPTYMSPSINKLLGYSIEEAMANPMEEVYAPASFEVAMKAFEEELAIERMEHKDPSRSRILELALKRKDGSLVPVEVNFTFIRDSDGQPIGILAVARNIAERKHAEEERRQSTEKLIIAMEATIEAMALTVKMRDQYTAGHQRRVTKLAIAIAEEIGLPKDEIDGIRLAGIVHDIGKINVPAEILSKPGQLSEMEFGLIKAHPQIGYDILKTVEFPWPIATGVLQHHERMNGSGYPAGLSGEDIILEARILAVADVVEAMSSHRPYRPALGIDRALEEITNNKGILYDADVVDACLRLFTEKGFEFE